MRRRHHFITATLLALLATPTTARAQEPDSTVMVVPGAQYAAGGLRRFLLGDHYRDTWTTAIEVPYLDLASFAGGLTPVSSHSGSQTKSLRFAGADGRRYQFRSVFKTPTAGLRAELQGTLVADLLQDGASASHPVGALVVAPLLEAVGVLHPKPYLAAMPDDPALGEFRESFRGLLGIVEERPDEAEDGLGGFGEAIQVISPTRLFERIDESPEDQVNARSFLTARLMDMLIGDRDRHRDNWRWALMDDSGPVRFWEPISRDHDEAFVNADGFLIALATEFYPQIVSFGPEYPSMLSLNWHAREIDRRYLVGLDRAVWDSVAGSIQARLTEQVVADAVRRLPEPMYDVGGPALERALLSRLRLLPQAVDGYYGLLAGEVDIHATNAAEIAEITWVDDRYVDIVIRAKGDDGVPYLRRRFDERVTREVRLSMWGGADRVIVRGEGDPDITIRVVGGRGRDVFVDSSTGGGRGVRFYDSGRNTEADLSKSSLNRKPYPAWIGSDLDRYPPREWGSWTRRTPWLSVGPNVGLLIGGGIRKTHYGFRRDPYSADWSLRAGISTGEGWGAAEFEGEFRRENSQTHLGIEAYVSGIEILNFYGLGNDTEPDPTFGSYRVPMNEIWLHPALKTQIGTSLEVGIGPWLRVSGTDNDDFPFFESIADTLYGANRFRQAGLSGMVEWDSRDREVATTSGVFVAAKGFVAPPLWDVEDVYGSVEGEARAYLTATGIGIRPTLALRAGAERVFGRAPFHESAFIGGRSTLRGWSRERFAGDASLYGSAELRFRLARFSLMVPGNMGLFGLADAARVYVDGDSPGGWHTAFGGGLWLSFVDPSRTLTFGFANGEERTAIYVGLGFAY